MKPVIKSKSTMISIILFIESSIQWKYIVFSFSLKIHVIAVEKVLLKEKTSSVCTVFNSQTLSFKYVFKFMMQKSNVAICDLLKVIFCIIRIFCEIGFGHGPGLWVQWEHYLLHLEWRSGPLHYWPDGSGHRQLRGSAWCWWCPQLQHPSKCPLISYLCVFCGSLSLHLGHF